MPSISIIMPVFNTGSVLQECLESIYHQTFTDYEIICVDDESQDEETIQILNTENNSGKINLISNKTHEGAAIARNCGFRYAKGEYVIFLDSDDVLYPEMLAEMYTKIKKENADICVCGHETFYIENEQKIIENSIIPRQHEIDDREDEEWICKVSLAPWNKLLRREFIKRSKLEFQNISSCNDVYFSCMAIILAKSIACTEKPLILHRIHQTTQISNNRDPYNFILACEKIKGSLCKLPNHKMYEHYYHSLLLMVIMGEITRGKNENQIRKSYEYTRKYFLTNIVQFSKPRLEFFRQLFMNNEDYQWIFLSNSYEGRLQMVIDKVIAKIKRDKEIYIWGMGVHGMALLNQLCNRNIKVAGITDINNTGKDILHIRGVKVMRPSEVLAEKGSILCSNNKIYQYLNDLYDQDLLIDLDDICPY